MNPKGNNTGAGQRRPRRGGPARRGRGGRGPSRPAGPPVEPLHPTENPPEIDRFDEFDLHPTVLAAIDEMGIVKPTPIQALAIGPVLEGKDVIAKAETGTGKTLAFGAPMISKIDSDRATVLGLALCPTRELAEQVAVVLEKLGEPRGIKVALIVGGEPAGPQVAALQAGAQVVVGTPGRVIDLYEQRFLSFPWTEFVVLDEADEMLEIGFIDDVKKILKFTPDERQTLLFSATFPDALLRLARDYTTGPAEIATASGVKTVDNITQQYVTLDESDRALALIRMIERSEDEDVFLVFCERRTDVERLMRRLERLPFSVKALHGGYDQSARFRVMGAFRTGEVKVLVATDVASRGLDVKHVTRVVNFGVPRSITDYTHRIGRTGRAGREGHAVTLVSHDNMHRWKSLLRDATWTIEEVDPPGSRRQSSQPSRERVERSPREDRPREDRPREDRPREERSREERPRQDRTEDSPRESRSRDRDGRGDRDGGEPREERPRRERSTEDRGERAPRRRERTREESPRDERPARSERPTRDERPARGERRIPDNEPVSLPSGRKRRSRDANDPPPRVVVRQEASDEFDNEGSERDSNRRPRREREDRPRREVTEDRAPRRPRADQEEIEDRRPRRRRSAENEERGDSRESRNRDEDRPRRRERNESSPRREGGESRDERPARSSRRPEGEDSRASRDEDRPRRSRRSEEERPREKQASRDEDRPRRRRSSREETSASSGRNEDEAPRRRSPREETPARSRSDRGERQPRSRDGDRNEGARQASRAPQESSQPELPKRESSPKSSQDHSGGFGKGI